MAFNIYIIINNINKKFYIGKTTSSIQKRFKRHLNDATSMRCDTRLAKAIRKYGVENFYVEQLDTASTEDELNHKEQYWIEQLNAIKEGYNASNGGEGGNTYQHKTEVEMDTIRDKIRRSKTGNLNPHASAVKCKNIKTGQELYFKTVLECQKHFKEDNHSFITTRCVHKTKYAYNGEWLIAYQQDDYIDDYKTEKDIKRKKQIKVVEIESKVEHQFESYIKAEKHFGLKPGFFSKHACRYQNQPFWEKAGYRIFVLG